ncbi:DNA polymerase I [Desulfovibrio sp. OttesenSCG-928-C06]|nr:DNA polymerase I [Desulfovibrio sp. OttesenSCG-928-C06]
MSLRQRLGLSADPVFLMDGSAYIFRGFYANQNMSRADGTPTNVLFMVLRLLLKILREESPSHFAFVLDGRGKNFRHRLYEDYKAHRLVTPEALSVQIPPLMQAVRDLGLYLTVSEDCEADDCIASLAARLSKDYPVVIIGADKDLKQCLAPNVYIWDPSSKDEKLIGLDKFREENGFEPRYWPDYQAIVGDSSDNIPGVQGIGAKGAGTLLREFKGLEDIFGRLAAVPPTLRKKLEGNEEKAMLSRQLTTLKLDCCAEAKLEDLVPQPPKQAEIMNFLSEYELRSLSRELSSMLRISSTVKSETGAAGDLSLSGAFANLPGRSEQGAASATSGGRPESGNSANLSATDSASMPGASNTTDAPGSTSPANPASPASSGGSAKSQSGKRAEQAQGFLWGSAGNLAATEQVSLLGDGGALAAPSFQDAVDKMPLLDTTAALAALPQVSPNGYALVFARDLSGDKNDNRIVIGNGERDFLFQPEMTDIAAELVKIIGQAKVSAPEFKALCELCPALRSLPLENCFDLSIAAWLLNPEEYDYSFRKLERHWGAEARAYLEQNAASAQKPGESGWTPGALALAMRAIIENNLDSNNLAELMRNMEMPLVPVLLYMQDIGLGIDKAAFADFLAETERSLAVLTQAIYEAAGKEFNIRSAKQLGDVLFEDLGLPKAKKTSGGQTSTSQESLEKLSGKHPIIEKLLEYRKLEKLRSTYLDPLPKIADADNRLHTSFNQSSTATGRLSSSNPNLQNIPVRGPLGVRMRACFTAAPGKVLVSADYSQIELRVLAHLSQDPTLLDAFSKNEDIHRRTASLLFDVPQSEVTPDQRRNAKTINFGLVYGMGPQKLARELDISMNQAKEFIERYFEKLGKLREYYDQVENDARAKGYVSTMTGRRRPCPDILSANQQMRSRARRQAINTCIQGSAADIIKLAMLAAANDAELKRLEARLILQIHDELLLECAPENAEAAGKRLAELMSSVKPGGVALDVPLLSEWGSGRSWADAH